MKHLFHELDKAVAQRAAEKEKLGVTSAAGGNSKGTSNKLRRWGRGAFLFSAPHESLHLNDMCT